MTAPETCRLCPATSDSLHNQLVMCFEAPGESSGLAQDSVAEVLNKHFWFELQPNRDARAFVCSPCWRKVDAFHQFYQSVLELYQTHWLLAPKREPEAQPDAADTLVVDQKLEITIIESASTVGGNGSSDAEDCDSAAAAADDNIDHLQHSADEEMESPQLSAADIPKRGRSLRSNRASTELLKLEALSDEADSDHPQSEDRLLSQYFTLQCDLCSATLPSLETARIHHQREHQQRGYLSCGCGQRFYRLDKVREHCAFHADPAQWKCTECCKIFTSCGRLATHRRTKHAAEEAEEAADGAEEVPKSDAIRGQKRVEDDLIRAYMPMQCDVCNAEYEHFNEARRHHQKVHGTPGYMKCCGKQFWNKCKAVEHCQWHRNPTEFDCATCSRNFTTLSALNTHRIRHHPADVPFSHRCDQCDATFQVIGRLRYHQQRQHLSPDKKRFECYRCHRRYVFISELRTHLRDAHQTGPSHVCDVCAKYFKSKASYELHYAVEHGNRSLKVQCPECGKWLKHSGTLWRHQRQMHRSVPKTCTDCGHVSPNNRALYMHRRRAHRAAAYECLVCGVMLKRKDRLREHMALHAGITDLYKCAFCPKTFRSNGNMYKHRTQEHAAELAASRLAQDARNAAEVAASRRADGNG